MHFSDNPVALNIGETMHNLLPVVAELTIQNEEASDRIERFRNGNNRDLPLDLVVDGGIVHLRYVGSPSPAHALERFWYVFIDTMHEAYNVGGGDELYYCLVQSEDGQEVEVVQAVAIGFFREGVPSYAVFAPSTAANPAT